LVDGFVFFAPKSAVNIYVILHLPKHNLEVTYTQQRQSTFADIYIIKNENKDFLINSSCDDLQ